MDIKQNSVASQSADSAASQNKSSGTPAGSLLLQIIIRTMAGDLEILSKETKSNTVTLYTKQLTQAKTAAAPTDIIQPKPIVTPQIPTVLKSPTSSTPYSILKAAAPPPDLPISKKETVPQEPPETLAPPEPPEKKIEPKITIPESEIFPLLQQPAPPAVPLPLEQLSKFRLNRQLLSKVAVIFGILIIISLGVWGWLYWRSMPVATPTPSPSISQSATPSLSAAPLVIPPPLFDMEKQEVVELATNQNYVLNEILQPFAQSPTNSAFTQIAFKTTGADAKEKIATLTELISAMNLDFMATAASTTASTSAPTLNKYLDDNQYTVFIYYQLTDGSSPFTGSQYTGRVGLVASLKNGADENEFKQALKSSETNMPSVLKSLWFGKNIEIPTKPELINNTYKEIPIRYLNFPFSTLSLDYAIVKGNFLLATSKETMYAAIDRLLNVATSSMADWQTYRNEKYSFEIKYPSDLLNITEGASHSGGLDNIAIDAIKQKTLDNQKFPAYLIDLDIADNQYQTEDDFFSKESEKVPKTYNEANKTWRILNFAGKKWLEIWNFPGVYPSTQLSTPYNKYVYNFSFMASDILNIDSSPTDSDSAEGLRIFKGILSTFKFIPR